MSNPILVIIIAGGLFNFAVRLAQQAQVQRAKRAAHQERARQKQEALRTGRPIAPSGAQDRAFVSSVESASNPADDRRERIEALRKERMAQLQALRAKRAAVSNAQASGSGVSPNHPHMLPVPVQTKQVPQPGHSKPKRSVSQRLAQARTPASAQRSAQAPTQASVQARQSQSGSSRRRSSQPKASQTNQTRKAPKVSARKTELGSKNQQTRSRQARGGGHSARSMLRSKSSLRQAMVLREVLDTPIALRDDDVASGSLFS